MSYNLMKFQQDNLSTGVQAYTSDFSPDFKFAMETRNVSTGIRQGVGPRFGMSPIPAQQDTEGVATEANSIRQSEGAGSAYENRTRFFGVIPVTLGLYSDLTIKKTHFVWLVGTGSQIDAVIGSSGASPYIYSPTIYSGLPASNAVSSAVTFSSPAVMGIQNSIPAADPKVNLAALLANTGASYISSATMSVTGKAVPQKWMVGQPISAPTLTDSGTPNFVLATSFNIAGQTNKRLGGVPWFINTKNLPTTKTTIVFYNMAILTAAATDFAKQDMFLYKQYTYELFQFTTANTFQALNQNRSIAQVIPGAATSVTNNFFPAVYSDPTLRTTRAVLMNCNDAAVNSSYTAIMLANPTNPLICVIQEWFVNEDGTVTQWVDPTQTYVKPRSMRTQDPVGVGGTYYQEGKDINNLRPVETCFLSFPTYDTVTPVGAYVANGLTPVSLGAANSGLLRKNTSYEMTYSWYNKRLNYETNVGTPAKFLTGDDDFVAISVGRDTDGGSDGTSQKYAGHSILGYYRECIIPHLPDFQSVFAQPKMTSINVNDYEIRIYCRELGSFEWLPALFIDAAEYFYKPHFGPVWACQSAMAALPGGQPGGFNDYSELPKDQYDCVVGWNSRVFWSSNKNVVFSMRDNVFGYPLRNSVAAPTGEFRGLTVHAFPGQAEQRGRLVIWGSEEVYAARFTGNQQTSPVQISPDVVGEYPLDGSDFAVERWTTNTSFSYRSAVVAEGILYYWGAKGIFRDDGVTLPERISINIEPDLFKLYDPTLAGDIFSHYFEQSREIMWFYTPIASPTITHAIILNIVTGGIYRAEFDCKIDSICSVNIENTSDTQKYLVGKRTVLSVRHDSTATIQRPYFFDLNNRAGDLKPGHEAMVKAYSTVGNTVTLTLASGYDAATLNTLVAGDKMTVHQAAYYNGQAVEDMICTVVSKNLPTIVVTKPATASFGANWTAAARKEYFPVWFAPLTAIPYRIKSQYWCPETLAGWFRFLFTHFVFRVNLMKSTSTYDLSLGYRTPISSTLGTKTVTLTDNSDGNCQIYAPLPGDNQTFEGQGIRYDIAGLHNGGEWVLQYIGNHAEPQDGDNLQTFEA